MNGRYAVVAGRIRQELVNLDRVVARVQRAMKVVQQYPEDQDILLDSVALNLHDFYAGLERVFQVIAANIDQNMPTGREWHRDLLLQMAMAVPNVRPQVLSPEAAERLDEYLRFRHVVRNVYAFQFDPGRLQSLVDQLTPTFDQVRRELLAFAELLEQLAQQK